MAYCQFLQPPRAGADSIKFSEYLHARQRVKVTVHGLRGSEVQGREEMLQIEDLQVKLGDKEILKHIDLEILYEKINYCNEWF